MIENSQEWRNSLKEGDSVIVQNGIDDTLERVSRVTATQIIIGKNARFNKRRGRLIGVGSWNYTFIVPADPERIAEMEEKKRRQRIKKNVRTIGTYANWVDSVPKEKLEIIDVATSRLISIKEECEK